MKKLIDNPNIKELAEQGDAEAQYQLGMRYFRSYGGKGDDKEARHWFWMAALQGHPKGMWKIAGMLSDAEQALIWTLKAAEAGCANAQWWAGCLYLRGEGVIQGNEQAVYWYKKAAEQGDASALDSLGKCYASGLGVEQSWQEAANYYEKSAREYKTLYMDKCTEEYEQQVRAAKSETCKSQKNTLDQQS
ncbi:MAG: tetratricopeptide repeat protein [Nitrosomonadales bacterium]